MRFAEQFPVGNTELLQAVEVTEGAQFVKT